MLKDEHLGNFKELQICVKALIADAPDIASAIRTLRASVDEAADSGRVQVKEWRLLLDELAAVQRDTENSGAGPSTGNPLGRWKVTNNAAPSARIELLRDCLRGIK